MMFFSRIMLSVERLKTESLSRLLGQDSYHDHQMVWRLFPGRPDAERDFLFRKEMKEGWPCFYVVSVSEPCDTSGLWQIETKPYDPRVLQGQKLAFNVRVNPVVTRWDETGEKRRQVRHDIIMDAKKAQGYGAHSPSDRPNETELMQQAGVSWMQSRCKKWGFSTDIGGIRVDGYRQHRIFKKGKNHPICFSTLEYTGLLTVDDPDRFRQTLFQGIGKSRGLGCGLLLVKPARY